MAKVHTISDSGSDDEDLPLPTLTITKPDAKKEAQKFSISKLMDVSSSEDESQSKEKLGLKGKRRRAESSNSDTESTDIDDELVDKLETRYDKSKAKSLKNSSSLSSEIVSQAIKQERPQQPQQQCFKTHSLSDSEEEADSPIPNELSKQGSNSSQSQANPRPTNSRPLCRFGLTCFRQNKSHLRKFSHPDEVTETKAGKQIWTRPSLPSRNSFEGNESDDGGEDGSSSRDASTTFLDSDVIEVINAAQPYGYFLTKVTGIDDEFNHRGALSMRDILSPLLGTLEQSVQFNYCIDINWMMTQYPPEFRNKPVLVVHGLQREAKADLINQASQYAPHIKLCQAKLPDPFGTHHTKMMILKYQEGLRVVILTANLMSHDWNQKSQGIWMSPLFPPITDSSQSGDSETNFKRDLVDYIRAYRASDLKPVEEMLTNHDMSSAKVFLLGSVPGRHQGQEKLRWGHMRLRRILEDHAPLKQGTPTLSLSNNAPIGSSWYIMGQFSSIGSLGSNPKQWLEAEFSQSLSSMNPKQKIGFGSLDANSRLRLVFPCVEDVRNSLEGYQAGASLPYARATAAKQPWLKSFFHKWRASKRGRSLASPHIKSFAQIDPSHSKAAWFVSTSANLSKAAWGALEKNQSQLFIRSYELGVLFVPRFFSRKEDYFEISGQDGGFPFPVDLPLTPYGQFDKPWLWDVNYDKETEVDSHGRSWEPNK